MDIRPADATPSSPPLRSDVVVVPSQPLVMRVTGVDEDGRRIWHGDLDTARGPFRMEMANETLTGWRPGERTDTPAYAPAGAPEERVVDVPAQSVEMIGGGLAGWLETAIGAATLSATG